MIKFFAKERIGNKTTLHILGIKIKYANKDENYLGDITKQWETRLNPQKLEKDIRYLLKNPLAMAEHNREIMLILISTLLENGKSKEAETRLKEYVAKYGLTDLYAFPLVCCLACKLNLNDERIKKCAEIFEVLEANRNSEYLRKMLAGKTVAVVGNSPNLQGKELGAKIDGFDYVVRFNNYKTQGFEKDYGTKTNIWVCCQANDIENKAPEIREQLAAIVYSVDFKHTKLREKCFNNLCDNLTKDSFVSYISGEDVRDLSDIVDYPSSGLSILYLLHQLNPLKRENIYGFSFLEESADFYDHYWKKRSKRKIKKFFKNCHHDFQKEIVFAKNFWSE